MSWEFYTPDSTPTMGISLPASPVDGQEFTLVDSMTAPTYSWKLRYVSAKSSNKWIFIGGAPGIDSTTAVHSTTATAYASMTDPVNFTVPVAGDYLAEWGSRYYSEGTSASYLGYIFISHGATAASDTWAIYSQDFYAPGPGNKKKITGLPASDVIDVKVRSSNSAGTLTVDGAHLVVWPLALGG